MGAVNAFNCKTNSVRNCLTNQEMSVSDAAKDYQKTFGGSFITAEENYGEGSSREHAAMEPRFLGVKFIVAKSFARIHETNLKKQGILALTFENPDDYALIKEGDKASLTGLKEIRPGSKIQLRLAHTNGTTDEITLVHTYNNIQIDWFKAGAALNVKR